MRWRIVGIIVLIAATIYVANASWTPWAAAGRGEPILLAHRGVAQQFSREGLDATTCTAAQMSPPTHDFLENTLPSMDAAFSYGADIVEIDIHPTTDGEFAVFHDWTLECRTDGAGVTREQTMTYLKTLDIGHGYTADGGESFPFRGRFKGAMPTLAEALVAFPDKRFLINVKGNDPAEADLLAAYLAAHGEDAGRLMFYGGGIPIARLRTLMPEARLLSQPVLKDCLLGYIGAGWIGRIPDACRNSVIFMPINYRKLMWGWPNLFVARMKGVGAEVFMTGPLTRSTTTSGSTAIDDPEEAAPFVRNYAGGLATDRIEVIGPYMKPDTAN